jgi:ATP-binding cassette, subfamily C, bacterial CydD
VTARGFEPRTLGFNPSKNSSVSELDPVPERFDLSFEHVNVAYDAGSRPALRGFTLAVPHGSTVALVGETGAGKSTVAGVLLRFVEPDSGAVFVGGVPLNAVDPVRWRTRVAYVPQHPSLFHGTVADNIRLGRLDATDEEVVAAARAAQAHRFVSALPAGYASPVGERGALLSGGERQRIALARALLRDAPLLVLDEATSHLDRESEALVLGALCRRRRRRTVILITHRPAVARDADLVATLHAGRVVEVGPPAVLAS